MIRLTFVFLFCSMLQITHGQDCTAESAAINANSDVSGAYSAFQSEATEALQNFAGFCRIIQRSCVKDLGELTTASQLESACLSNNGQVVRRDARLDCKGSIAGIPIPGGFRVGASNFPACVGASCDPDSLPADIETVIDSVTDTAKSQIENALGDSVECTVYSAGWTAKLSTTLVVLAGIVSWSAMV